MLILGLPGMYFDAAVVLFTISSLFLEWLWPCCADKTVVIGLIPKICHDYNSKNHLGWQNSLKKKKHVSKRHTGIVSLHTKGT